MGSDVHRYGKHSKNSTAPTADLVMVPQACSLAARPASMSERFGKLQCAGATTSQKMSDTLFQSAIKSLPLVHRGKVRDVYAVGSDHLLIVTTDRLSAFDVVLPTPIPGKGAVLTELSNFWFARTRHVVPNHLADLPLAPLLIDA